MFTVGSQKFVEERLRLFWSVCEPGPGGSFIPLPGGTPPPAAAAPEGMAPPAGMKIALPSPVFIMQKELHALGATSVYFPAACSFAFPTFVRMTVGHPAFNSDLTRFDENAYRYLPLHRASNSLLTWKTSNLFFPRPVTSGPPSFPAKLPMLSAVPPSLGEIYLPGSNFVSAWQLQFAQV
jgi:hypothetical protein